MNKRMIKVINLYINREEIVERIWIVKIIIDSINNE